MHCSLYVMPKFVFLTALFVSVFNLKLQVNLPYDDLLIAGLIKCSPVISDRSSVASDFNVIDSLGNYPCAQKVLSRLPYLTSETNHLFQRIFESDKETSIRFYPDFSLAGSLSDGKTRATGNLIFKYRIGINIDVLKHGTSEYILVALLHETLHVYLLHHIKLYNSGQIDSVTFKNEFQYFWKLNAKGKVITPSSDEEHQFIAEKYILLIKNAVKAYNPSVSDEFALAISWGGLEKTKAYHKQSANKRIYEYNLVGRDTGYSMKSEFKFQNGYRYFDFAATRCL